MNICLYSIIFLTISPFITHQIEKSEDTKKYIKASYNRELMKETPLGY